MDVFENDRGELLCGVRVIRPVGVQQIDDFQCSPQAKRLQGGAATSIAFRRPSAGCLQLIARVDQTHVDPPQKRVLIASVKGVKTQLISYCGAGVVAIASFAIRQNAAQRAIKNAGWMLRI